MYTYIFKFNYLPTQEKVLKDDSSVYTSSDSESETESISNVAIKKLQEENEALKKELEKQVKKIEEVTQINLKLQNQILSKFDAIDSKYNFLKFLFFNNRKYWLKLWKFFHLNMQLKSQSVNIVSQKFKIGRYKRLCKVEK